jgi:hypothetical protein
MKWSAKHESIATNDHDQGHVGEGARNQSENTGIRRSSDAGVRNYPLPQQLAYHHKHMQHNNIKEKTNLGACRIRQKQTPWGILFGTSTREQLSCLLAAVYTITAPNFKDWHGVCKAGKRFHVTEQQDWASEE